MLRRLLIFKGVFLASVIVCLGVLFVKGVVDRAEDLQSNASNVGRLIAKEQLQTWQWPILGGSLLLACGFAFGDLLTGGRSRHALPTYSDAEFIARFGGKAPGSE
jgi:hypothetical protein